MLENTRNYLYDRRRGLLTTVGGLGVGYVTGQYIIARLEEVRDRIVRERGDKDK
jgi:peroxin-3